MAFTVGDAGHVPEHNRITSIIDNLGITVLDSFAGGSDDAKLTAAMSYAAAQTHPPVIQLTNRTYSFATQRILYTGFRLRGVGASSNSELGDANMGCLLNLSTNGPWLYITADAWDCLIQGISAIGTSTTTFLGCDSTHQLRGSTIRDVSFKQFLTVFGTQAQKLLMTTCQLDGYFQMQGTYNGGIHIGGSDNRLFMASGLVDASQAYNTAGNAAGQYHFWFDGLDNSMVGPLYITCSGLWGGVHVTGLAYNSGSTGNRGMLWMYGLTIEGQSASIPCNGAVLRVDGGIVKTRDGYIARGMDNPSAQGHSPQDAGVVHVTGGYLLLDGYTYDRCNSVGETVPYVYQSGGTVVVTNTSVATTGGAWVGLPRVKSTGGTMRTDSSVTVI